MPALRRCLNDSSYAYNPAVGCPVTACYRNEDGQCTVSTLNTNAAATQKMLTAAADAVAAITNAIDLTIDCIPTKNITERTQRFYKAKRNFFREAGITIEQLQAALNAGIDWIALVSVKRVELV